MRSEFVSSNHQRSPVLNKLYHEYLQNEDTATFILLVSQRYTTATLKRLVQIGARVQRRAAVLALGFLGGDDSCAVLARALADQDRGVRMLAENGIRAVWCRAGNESQRQRLRVIMRLNVSGQYEAAERQATRLISDAPAFAEVWNQRAIARYQLSRHVESIQDCKKALEFNPYHFGAATGMGQCYLKLGTPTAALECFRRALKLNPSLEAVRAKLVSLKRSLEDR